MKGTELVYLSFLLGLCLMVIVFVFSGSTSRSDGERALWRAESLALQIQQVRAQNVAHLKSQVASQEDRMPASLDLSREQLVSVMKPFRPSGEIGVDPWGQPYQFHVFNHSSGSYILVWSAGADRQPSTDPLEILVSAAEGKQVAFLGDDQGLILPLE